MTTDEFGYEVAEVLFDWDQNIRKIDSSDPNNLVVTCMDGQQFTIRIIAGEKG